MQELRRVKAGPAKAGPPPLVGHDLEIVVMQGPSQSTYRVYARTIIQDTTTGETWQFYMGLLLMEWASA